MPADPQSLLERIKALPAERLAQLDDFVEFLRQREPAAAPRRTASAETMESSR